MWVSKADYEKLKKASEEYKNLQKAWEIVCEQNSNQFKKTAESNAEIMRLKAERDWYKQNYADLLIKSTEDTVQRQDKCPVCGSELTYTEICTLPPIQRCECAKCGWNTEKAT